MDGRFLVDDLAVVNTSEFRAFSAVNDVVWTCQADGALAVRGRSGQIDRTIGDHLKDAACSILKRGPHVWVGYKSGLVRVFHAENLFIVATLEGHGAGPIAQFAVSGGCVFSCSALPGTFEVLQWNADKPGLLHRLAPPSGVASCPVALAPWRKGVACGADNGVVYVFDGQKKEPVQSLKGHKGAVQALLSLRTHLWSGGEDAALKVWDNGSGKLVETLAKHKGPIVAIAGSGDFVLSASLDRSINVWEAASRQFVRTLLGHTGALHGIAYVSAALKPTFWSSSEDGTLRKWTFEVAGPNIQREVPRWLGLSHLLPEEEESAQEKEKRDVEARWKMIIQDMETNFQDTVRRYNTEIEALKRDREQKSKPRAEALPDSSIPKGGASEEVRKLQDELQEMRKQQKTYDRKMKEAVALYDGIEKHCEDIKAGYERELQTLRQQLKKGTPVPDADLQRKVQDLTLENQRLRDQVEQGPGSTLEPGGIAQTSDHTSTEVYFILHTRAEFVAHLLALYGAMGQVRERLGHVMAAVGKTAGTTLGNDIADVVMSFGEMMANAGAILDQFFTEAEKTPRRSPKKKQPSGPKSHQSRSLVKAKPTSARERSASLTYPAASMLPSGRKRSPSPQVKLTARSISPTKGSKATAQSAKATPRAADKDRRAPARTSVSPPRRDNFAFFHGSARPPTAAAEGAGAESQKAPDLPRKGSMVKGSTSPAVNRHPPKASAKPPPVLPWPLEEEEGPAPRERAPVPTAPADGDRKSPYRRPMATTSSTKAPPLSPVDHTLGDSPHLSSRDSPVDSLKDRSPSRRELPARQTVPRSSETPSLLPLSEGGRPARSPGSALVDLTDDGSLRAALPRPATSPRVGARTTEDEVAGTGRRPSPFRAAAVERAALQREAEQQRQSQAALLERFAREAAQREADRVRREQEEREQREKLEKERRAQQQQQQEEWEEQQRQLEAQQRRQQQQQQQQQWEAEQRALAEPPPERLPPPPPPQRPPPREQAETVDREPEREEATGRATPEGAAMPTPLSVPRQDSGLGLPRTDATHDPRAALQRVKDQHKAILAKLRSMEDDNDSDTATMTSQKSDRRRRQGTAAKPGRRDPHGKKGHRPKGHTDSDFEVSSTSDSDTSAR